MCVGRLLLTPQFCMGLFTTLCPVAYALVPSFLYDMDISIYKEAYSVLVSRSSICIFIGVATIIFSILLNYYIS